MRKVPTVPWRPDLRILMFLNSLGLGGAETMLLRCMPYFLDNEISIDFCCTGGTDALDRHFEKYCCEIVRIPKSVSLNKIARAICHQCSKKDYDLIHSQYGYVSGGACKAANEMNIPIIVSFHGAMPYSLFAWRSVPILSQIRLFWLRWHDFYIRKYATFVVGHSHSNLDAFDKAWSDYPARYRFVRNCIGTPSVLMSQLEARQILGFKDSETLFLHVGSFERIKNHTGLLKIFKILREEIPDSTLVMVGDGSNRRNIEEEAKKLKLVDRVRFEGHQLDPWPYYFASNVFIFPSLSEGYGNVLVEAQAAMLPVVASDIPGLRESLAPAQTDCLFRLPDYRQAAELVQMKLVDSVTQDDQLKKAKHYALKLHSPSRMAEDLIAIYAEALRSQIGKREAKGQKVS